MIDDNASTSVTRDMERVFAKISGLSRRIPNGPPAKALPSNASLSVQAQPHATRLRNRYGAWTLAAVLVVLAAMLAVRLMPVAQQPSGRPAAVTSRIVTIPAHPTAPFKDEPPNTATATSPSETVPSAKEAVTKVRHRAKQDLRRSAFEPEHPAPSRVRQAKTRPVAPSVAISATVTLACENASDQARCTFGELLEADRRVRQAYAAATVAGVPVADMRRARSSWKRALSRSRKEPLVSIGTLNGLANSLRQSIRSASRLAG